MNDVKNGKRTTYNTKNDLQENTKNTKNTENNMGKYNWDKLKGNLQKGVGEKHQNDFNDPREWKLQRDEQDNGTAVIRLLPGKGGDTPPVVRIYEHSVRVFNKQSNKYRYFIEPSPSSIKEECPVSQVWYELGDIGTDASKKMQETFKRSTKFVSNILVVNDPLNPDNNGKVFYWKYGVKLFEKFQSVLEPTEAQIQVGKKPVQLFDPEDGANIILDIKRDGNFLNYDSTTIEAPSMAFDNEEDMDDAILEQAIDLTEFISKDHFKPYAELKKKLAWVLEKSPEETYIISNGSAVITEPYKKGSDSGSSTPKADPATDAMPTATYTPKTKKKEEVISEDPALEEAVDAVVTEVKAEPAKAKATPKKAPAKKVEASDDDDILSMLEDL